MKKFYSLMHHFLFGALLMLGLEHFFGYCWGGLNLFFDAWKFHLSMSCKNSWVSRRISIDEARLPVWSIFGRLLTLLISSYTYNAGVARHSITLGIHLYTEFLTIVTSRHN